MNTPKPMFVREVARIDDPRFVSGQVAGHRARRLIDAQDAAFADPFVLMAEDWTRQGIFAFHPHRGIETVSFVIEGSIEHRDSAGHGGVIHAGDAQWMTAGRGIQHEENPPAGTIAHTLQLWLNSDPALRQRSHAGLNKGEASNALRRAVFFHRQGEIRDRTFENQGFRASGLSLITAAIVHWNTVYLHRAVQHARALGATIPDDLLAHVAPLGWEHIALTGDYVWTNGNAAPDFRPLRDVPSAFMARAA